MWSSLSFLLFLPIFGNCHNVARFFGNAYTKTVIETQYLTSIIPSSCVMVEPTLPVCRNFRYLKFPTMSGLSFYYPPGNNLDIAAKSEPEIHTTALNWGEYLGFYAPTVTLTETEIQVATVQDPRTVVTFAIRGCKPLKFPNDIDRCPVEATKSISIEEIFSSTPIPEIAPSGPLPVSFETRTILEPLPESTGNLNLMEVSSTEPGEDNLSLQGATEPLPPL